MEKEKSPYILGVVPGRRVSGFAVLDESGLHRYGVKSLRRYKDDGQKMLVFNRLLCELINSYRPRVVIVLKLCKPKATSFNLQLLSVIRGQANSRYCPLYIFSLKQIKAVLGEETGLKNQRQLARLIANVYPELAHYLSANESLVIGDREKYYQPLFGAVGLAISYLKLTSNDNANTIRKIVQP